MTKNDTSDTRKMNNPATIRQYRPNDLIQLMEVWESANSAAHPFLSSDFVAQLRHDIPALYLPNTDTWVATIKNRLVGFISLMGNEVAALFLSPECHGCGIGSALTNHAQRLQGNLEDDVFESNSIGRKFYQRYGFQFISEYPHEPTGENVMRMKYIANDSQWECCEVHKTKVL